jgi:hypothetical protein
VAFILSLCHVLRSDRLKEARPAGAGIEFGIRRKQRQSTTGAGVNTRLLIIEQRAAKRPLRPLAAKDAELLRRQPLSPLVVGQFELGKRERTSQLTFGIEDA